MDPSTQAVPGYYVWAVPGKSVTVHLHLDVIDRLSAEVMRGFGLVPKRGAEVGGVLIGTIEQGAQTIVRVEDFEPIACDYKRGPSYLFTSDDGAAFHDACERWQPESSRSAYAVGFFRSHTRDGLSFGPEDTELMEQYFPSPAHIALLVKPFATKVSVASFFAREDGAFPSIPALEFPFRRRELTGEEAPPRRTMLERVPRRREPRAESGIARPDEEIADEPIYAPGPAYAYASPSKLKPRPTWVWMPLSFVFLLMGVALGFLTALNVGPKAAGASTIDYSLGLTVTKDGDNLSVKWNREAGAVKSSQKGVLEIVDGNLTKPVDLDAAQLRNGGILFRNASNNCRFRLTVYPQDGLSVMQVMEWQAK